MKKLHLLCFIMLGLIGTISYGQFRKVGYQPYWAGSASTIQYSKLTHINYAFALPQSDGHLKPLTNPGMLQQIVANAHAVGTKVFIAIGGYTDNGSLIDPTFETLASSSAGRTNLVNDALGLVSTYNLDGVDMDWEFPDPGASANNFASLMQQLSTALHSRGKELSAAVNSGYYGPGILSSVFAYVDFLNIMAYDNDGEANHSSYAFAQTSLNYWLSRGLPGSKAVLGVPFYARPSWNGFNVLVANGANPNLDQFGSDYYNGIPTIQAKTELAWNSGGGIMIWELSHDPSGVNSLVSAIHSKVLALSGNPTNINPTVNLTSPVNGAIVNAPASITISANAADSDGTISKIEFYNGATLLNSDVTAPYSFAWTNVAAGTYSLSAKAYDNRNAVTSSVAVSVTVRTVTNNQAPSVNITSPTNGSSFSAPASITINANASDADGSISRVEFYNGATLLNSDNVAPFSFTWSNVVAANYSITAKAYDNAGAITTSAAVSVMVNTVTGGTCSGVATYVENGGYVPGSKVQRSGKLYQCKPWPASGWCNGVAWGYAPGTGSVWADAWVLLDDCSGTSNQSPSVNITSPSNGSSFSAPASITINANATDADGSITKVEFYNGNVLLNSDNVAPYTFTWSNVAAANYSISAKAYDNAGAVTTSAVVSVAVNAVTGGTCSGVASYIEKGGYVPGSKVQRNGKLYQCKPWPASGWCNEVAWAYAPGTGSVWADAWVMLGSCSGTANQSPAVVLTSPVNGATPIAPASVVISANASDADGSISKVEFYNGATLLNSDNAAPYSFTWSSVAVGTYTISAKAYDNAGAVTTSAVVGITVKTSIGGTCAGVVQYVEKGGYSPGGKVQNGGKLYQCRPWPASGWCNEVAWAYAPGTGTVWADAWILLGTCSPVRTKAAPIDYSVEGLMPNPAAGVSYVELSILTEMSGEETMSIISSSGVVVQSKTIMLEEGENKIQVDVNELRQGIYLIKVGNKSFKLVRNQ